MTAFYIILVILILIFTILEHETGHFLAAKAVGIRATNFSIGFGPEIVGWDRGETRYSLKWVLAGGSVRILGMNPEDKISEEDKPRSYTEAPYWKRFIVIVAGSAANILLAFLFFYVLILGFGLPTQANLNSARIGPVTRYYPGTKEMSPAYQVGLKEGDLITEVNGVKVEKWADLTKQLRPHAGQTVTIVVKRGTQTLVLHPTLLSVKSNGVTTGKLSIEPYAPRERYNPVTAVWGATKFIGLETAAIGKGLASLFSVTNLKVLLGMKPRTINSPQSIVGGARLSVEAARQGADVFIALMGSIILVIAIFNLLPLPPLDGGHVLVIIIEKVTRRKVDIHKLAMVSWVVIIILSVIALRLAVLDIFNPIRLP
jgi:membrane-associated protease RseP (regulator of RpoE activity)